MLANTQAQVLLADLLTRVVGHPSGNRAFAGTITGLDTRYQMGPGHRPSLAGPSGARPRPDHG